MRFLPPTLALLLPPTLVLLLPACSQPPEPEPEPEADGLQLIDRAACLVDPACDYIFAVAHRGSSTRAPENTLLAHAIAEELGADAVELDVRATADDVLILMHDSTVDRTTDGSGAVSELTLDAIRDLHAVSHIDGVEDQAVPTFAEALAALGPTMLVNVDTKSDRWDLMFEDITAAGMLDRVWVQTGSAAQAQQVRDEYPELIQQADAETAEEVEALLPWAPEQVEIPIIVMEQEVFDVCTAHGIKPAQGALGLSDAGAFADIEQGGDGSRSYGVLVDRGVRVIQTDFPELLVPVLDAFNAERGWRRE